MSQWIPTHVQCTILRARDLRVKGKHDQNDAFVTIQLNKEKFQTSVVKSGAASVEWNEECDLPLLHQNDWLILTVCHKNFFGVDEFLGRCELPLNEFDWNERPRARWFTLRAKPNKKAPKNGDAEVVKLRGEVQIMLKFYAQNLAASTPDLAFKQKHSSLVGTLKHTLGASLRNLHKKESDDGSMPMPLSRSNNSKSNLSLAQIGSGKGTIGGFFSRKNKNAAAATEANFIGAGGSSNLISQTLPRNIGFGASGGLNSSKFGNSNNNPKISSAVFDSPRSSKDSGASGSIAAAVADAGMRTRSPSSVSQQQQQQPGGDGGGGFFGNRKKNVPPPSPLLGVRNNDADNMMTTNNTRTSPTTSSLVDDSFRESVKNVNNMMMPNNNSAGDSNNTKFGNKKSPAPQPLPQPVISSSASRRVPKVHKLAAGGSSSSVVGNLLSSSVPKSSMQQQQQSINPFEDDSATALSSSPGLKNPFTLRGNKSKIDQQQSPRPHSTFYAGDNVADVTDSNNAMSRSRANTNSNVNNNNRLQQQQQQNYNENDDDDENNNPFIVTQASPSSPAAAAAAANRGSAAAAAAAAVLNRSISNRSSLVSEQVPNGSTSTGVGGGKGASMERGQQPPLAQLSSSSVAFIVNGRGAANGYTNGYSNNNMNNNNRSPLARVEATINSALKPLTYSNAKVPRDLEMKYSHLERNDLLLRIAQLENDMESKDIEIDRMKSYLESLLSRVMEACPELLQSSSPE